MHSKRVKALHIRREKERVKERWRDREKDTETERERNRERKKEREREKEKERDREWERENANFTWLFLDCEKRMGEIKRGWGISVWNKWHGTRAEIRRCAHKVEGWDHFYIWRRAEQFYLFMYHQNSRQIFFCKSIILLEHCSYKTVAKIAIC